MPGRLQAHRSRNAPNAPPHAARATAPHTEADRCTRASGHGQAPPVALKPKAVPNEQRRERTAPARCQGRRRPRTKRIRRCAAGPSTQPPAQPAVRPPAPEASVGEAVPHHETVGRQLDRAQEPVVHRLDNQPCTRSQDPTAAISHGPPHAPADSPHQPRHHTDRKTTRQPNSPSSQQDQLHDPSEPHTGLFETTTRVVTTDVRHPYRWRAPWRLMPRARPTAAQLAPAATAWSACRSISRSSSSC
ncbi:MAG: hypothetical protein JWN55_450 [Frankiales bacterium]|nr:hypothetical protein [Frankiales bacterium]